MSEPIEGVVYQTKNVPDKGLPSGTLVKVIKVDGGDVTVQRANGTKVVIKVTDLQIS